MKSIIKIVGIYKDGKRKGLITESYWKWRREVVKRVNKLYGTNHKWLSARGVLKYLNKSL